MTKKSHIKRQQGIFLSSTDDPEVRKYRLAAREVLQEEEFRDHWYAVEMDTFTPSRSPSLEACKDRVLSCSIFVGILGPFYGSLNDDVNLSYSEYEYTVALDAAMEIGIFLLPDDILNSSLPEIIKKQGALLHKQEAFKERVNAAHTNRPVSDLEDFKAHFRRYIRSLSTSTSVRDDRGASLEPTQVGATVTTATQENLVNYFLDRTKKLEREIEQHTIALQQERDSRLQTEQALAQAKEEIKKLRQKKVQVHVTNADRSFRQGKWKKANEAINVLLTYLDEPVLFFNRGVAHIRENKLDAAIADFTKAIDLKLDYAEAYFGRGVAHFDQGNFEQTIADCTKAIDLNPDYAEAYNNRGVAYFNQGNFEQALADYTKAIDLNPDDAKVYSNRGFAHTKLGNLEQAIADCTKATALKPDYALAYNNRGLAHSKQSNFEQAIADYTKAINLKPDFALAYNNRGGNYFKQSNFEQAIADWTKAINLNPDDADACRNRGAAHAELSNFEQAIADYTKAIALKPDDANAYINRGKAHANQGNLEQAIADCTKAIDLNPDDADSYFSRGFTYFQKGNNRLALDDFEVYCRLNPSNPTGHNNRGYLLLQLNQISKAEQAWQTATALPDAPHYAFAGHAVALWQLKKYEQAVTQYRQAIDLDERWRNDLQTVAAEYAWTDGMIQIAQKILEKAASL